MQVKTINRVIKKKLNSWLETITDEELRKKVKNNILVSGGSITSMLLGEKVNDFYIYIQNMNVLVSLAEYYCPNKVLDGRKKQEILKKYYSDKFPNFNINDDFFKSDLFFNDLSELAVRYKNLKEDQVKLDIPSFGVKCEVIDNDDEYQLSFLSPNAISLTNDIQIVLRFNGKVEDIHKTFDFIHATNYFTFKEGLVTNIEALQCILTRELKYQGSLYPLTSIIRIKKFLKRGWRINSGEMLKIMFQISELNLKDPEVLEEQLIGVDIAYFSKLIEIIRGVSSEDLTSSYLNTLIDKVFNDYDEEDDDDIESNDYE